MGQGAGSPGYGVNAAGDAVVYATYLEVEHKSWMNDTSVADMEDLNAFDRTMNVKSAMAEVYDDDPYAEGGRHGGRYPGHRSHRPRQRRRQAAPQARARLARC